MVNTKCFALSKSIQLRWAHCWGWNTILWPQMHFLKRLLLLGLHLEGTPHHLGVFHCKYTRMQYTPTSNLGTQKASPLTVTPGAFPTPQLVVLPTPQSSLSPSKPLPLYPLLQLNQWRTSLSLCHEQPAFSQEYYIPLSFLPPFFLCLHPKAADLLKPPLCTIMGRLSIGCAVALAWFCTDVYCGTCP